MCYIKIQLSPIISSFFFFRYSKYTAVEESQFPLLCYIDKCKVKNVLWKYLLIIPKCMQRCEIIHVISDQDTGWVDVKYLRAFQTEPLASFRWIPSTQTNECAVIFLTVLIKKLYSRALSVALPSKMFATTKMCSNCLILLYVIIFTSTFKSFMLLFIVKIINRWKFDLGKSIIATLTVCWSSLSENNYPVMAYSHL